MGFVDVGSCDGHDLDSVGGRAGLIAARRCWRFFGTRERHAGMAVPAFLPSGVPSSWSAAFPASACLRDLDCPIKPNDPIARSRWWPLARSSLRVAGGVHSDIETPRGGTLGVSSCHQSCRPFSQGRGPRVCLRKAPQICASPNYTDGLSTLVNPEDTSLSAGTAFPQSE
ncbi:MAG: hypothetical protein CL927_02525 [Deltaproteobacteria bacterium]|nr:hypothetical protein [Deltaproteobacteria bacterium]HCH65981.1 hypothetical protein [Deltaproteobacteria bacterium]